MNRINPLGVIFWFAICIFTFSAWGWAGVAWTLIIATILTAIIDQVK